jgi:chromate transporter
MTTTSARLTAEAPAAHCTLRELVLYFLRLGTFGFGGPIALVGYMQRDLVEDRRWISKQDYGEGLALAQLAPGPLAAQLAIYLGWLRGGSFGATLVAIAFVLPSFLMVLALSWFYLRYEGLSWMQGAFYGIGAAVIAIIGRSVYKLMRSTLGRDRLLWAIFSVSTLVTAWTESEIAWLFVLAGVVIGLAAYLLRRPQPRRPPWPSCHGSSPGCTGRPRRTYSGRSPGTSPKPARSCSAADSPSCPSCMVGW